MFDYARIETPDEQTFVSRAVETLERCIATAIDERGRCILGLSGGKTPRPIYSGVAASRNIDWDKVDVFLVDERFVPPDHEESNFRMIQETLLSRLPSPPLQILPDTTLPLAACVKAYDERLKDLFREGRTADVVTLGMGDDGHIASLFPPVPDEAFGDARAIYGIQDRFAVRDRISVTLPCLTPARCQLFLLSGTAKAALWDEMASAERDPHRWPAHALLETGRVTLLLQA